MIIQHLKINGIEKPLGYDFSHLTVSWTVAGTESRRQRSSRVRIASDPDFKTEIAEQNGLLPSAGVSFTMALSPRTRYYVSVRVEGDQGDEAEAVTWFETGKMDEPWIASWIGTQPEDSFHPRFEKSFTLSRKVSKARLYITGLGLFEAQLNGEKIGDELLAPGFNDYRSAVQVQSYDVTALLKGENRLAVLLGRGWYMGRLGYEGGASIFGDRFALRAELHIDYSDGSREVISTDESWQYTSSDVLSSDIYDGEATDRRIHPKELERKPASILADFAPKTAERFSPPVRVAEYLPVREILHTPAGETVLDFGQNFAGFVRFHAHFPAGTKIVLEHGEILQNGNFYHDNYRTAKTTITYISDGRDEWFQPRFTFMGFRYVRVTGWPGEPGAEDFLGAVIHSDMERTGTLSCGHDGVNRLFDNALWGLKSNFVDMPTDCPQRDERLGWTGDAQIFAPTASFFMDTRAFYRKFLWDMRLDQLRNNGAVAAYLPNFSGAPLGAAAWADAAALIPATLYERFGDTALLREEYPLMRDWVEWLMRKDAEHPGGPKHLIDNVFTFGDWLAMDGVTEQSFKGGTDDAFVSSVYYYASVCRTAEAAKALGLAEDARRYRELSEQIREAILFAYFAPSGRLCVNTQAAYVIALRFGIWRDREALCHGLRSRLKLDGYRIRCGFVGAPLLCETLADNGMEDLAMHIFLQEKFPSWLHCIRLGATTIWERWNSVLDDGSISGTGMNSLNHYSYGSVVSYAIHNLAGIKALEPGWRSVRIAPYPDARLGHLHCSYRSASGLYVTNWDIEDDGSLHVHIEVPFDCTAELVLPGSGENVHLEAGIYDRRYHPERDYRCLYGWDTLLDDVADDPRAMALMKETLPTAYGMALSGDLENLGLSFADMKQMPWFGFAPGDVDRLAEKLFQLKRETCKGKDTEI